MNRIDPSETINIVTEEQKEQPTFSCNATFWFIKNWLVPIHSVRISLTFTALDSLTAESTSIPFSPCSSEAEVSMTSGSASVQCFENVVLSLEDLNKIVSGVDKSMIAAPGLTSRDLCLKIGDFSFFSSTGSYRDARPAAILVFICPAAREGLTTFGSLRCLLAGVESKSEGSKELKDVDGLIERGCSLLHLFLIEVLMISSGRYLYTVFVATIE